MPLPLNGQSLLDHAHTQLKVSAAQLIRDTLEEKEQVAEDVYPPGFFGDDPAEPVLAVDPTQGHGNKGRAPQRDPLLDSVLATIGVQHHR